MKNVFDFVLETIITFLKSFILLAVFKWGMLFVAPIQVYVLFLCALTFTLIDKYKENK